MRVHVVFYGRLKQDTGTKQAVLDFDAQALTVRDVVDRVVTQYPALRPLLDTVACTIGAELVSPDQAVRDGDEVGLLPPVSGG